MKIINNKENEFQFNFNESKNSLDILLELIKKRKMDIYNLNFSELTNQFMIYFDNMKNSISLEEFSDYANMLSYLVELKTRSLIPNQDLDLKTRKSYDEEQEAFIRRLLEHQMYKNAIPLLENNRINRSYYIDKLPEEYDDYLPQNIPLGKLPKKMNIQKLADIFEIVLQKQSIKLSLETNVNLHTKTQEYSLENVIYDLLTFLQKNKNDYILFSNLFLMLENNKKNIDYFCMLFFVILSLVNQNYINIKFEENESSDFSIKLNNENINSKETAANFINDIKRDLFGEE